MNTNNNNGGNAGNGGNRDHDKRDKTDGSKPDVSSPETQKSAPTSIAQGGTDSRAKLDEKSQANAKVDPSSDAGEKTAK